MNLAILCPSRGRPEGLRTFIESIIKTTTGDNVIDVVIGIDKDDEMRKEYYTMLMNLTPCIHVKIWLSLAERAPVLRIWDRLLKYRMLDNPPDWFICGNDDFEFETYGWDLLLADRIDHLPHKYYMLWFDDGIQHGNHAASPILSREWVDAVGFYYPTHFHHNYPDTYVNDVARQLGYFQYIPYVMMRHKHYSTPGGMPYDQTYDDGLRGDAYNRDREIFNKTADERAEIVKLIKSKL